MLQESIGLAVVLFFILRLGWQFYKDQISKTQVVFWSGFWFLAGLLIVFIHSIDAFAARLGFSSSGIQLLFYVAVALLFYWIFRLRLTIDKMSREITSLTRSIAFLSKKHRE